MAVTITRVQLIGRDSLSAGLDANNGRVQISTLGEVVMIAVGYVW
jgi:hypothetical protein